MIRDKLNNLYLDLIYKENKDEVELINYLSALTFYFYFNENYNNKFDISINKIVDYNIEPFKLKNIDKFLANIKYNNEKSKQFYLPIVDILNNRYLSEEEINRILSVIKEYSNYSKFYMDLLDLVESRYIKYFTTPMSIVNLISEIVKSSGNYKNIYDPTIGSGLAISAVAKHNNIKKTYGQDIESFTETLSKVNLIINDINYKNINIKIGDSIKNSYFKDKKFDCVIGHPPIGNESTFASFFSRRIKALSKLPPESVEDFKFIEHMTDTLKDDGLMAIVLSPGIIFRSRTEEIIRKELVKNNYLDAVIALPERLNPPTVSQMFLLIVKKNRNETDEVLFIDASELYERKRRQNYLTDLHIEKIVNVYKERKDIKRFSYNATKEELKDNEYNLNITRYISQFEKEELLSINKLKQKLIEINEEKQEIQNKIDKLM